MKKVEKISENGEHICSVLSDEEKEILRTHGKIDNSMTLETLSENICKLNECESLLNYYDDEFIFYYYRPSFGYKSGKAKDNIQIIYKIKDKEYSEYFKNISSIHQYVFQSLIFLSQIIDDETKHKLASFLFDIFLGMSPMCAYEKEPELHHLKLLYNRPFILLGFLVQAFCIEQDMHFVTYGKSTCIRSANWFFGRCLYSIFAPDITSPEEVMKKMAKTGPLQKEIQKPLDDIYSPICKKNTKFDWNQYAELSVLQIDSEKLISEIKQNIQLLHEKEKEKEEEKKAKALRVIPTLPSKLKAKMYYGEVNGNRILRVAADTICNKLKKYNKEFQKSWIKLEYPITQTGEHNVEIVAYENPEECCAIKTTITLTVTK